MNNSFQLSGDDKRLLSQFIGQPLSRFELLDAYEEYDEHAYFECEVLSIELPKQRTWLVIEREEAVHIMTFCAYRFKLSNVDSPERYDRHRLPNGKPYPFQQFEFDQYPTIDRITYHFVPDENWPKPSVAWWSGNRIELMVTAPNRPHLNVHWNSSVRAIRP